MVGATERAKEELKRILDENADQPEACLRLTANDEGQLGLAIDVERKDDQAIEHEDSKVLLIEDDLADTLQEITIDVEDTPDGARLIMSSKT